MTILNEIGEDADPEARHALGLVYLASGNIDGAQKQFEEAYKDDPNNAKLNNDLGILWLEKGKAEEATNPGQSIQSYSMALDRFISAYELDDSLLEALFNRALAHQALMQQEQAAEQWQLYIEKDPNSRWSEEAKDNLRRLTERKKKAARDKEHLLKEFMIAYEKRDDSQAWNAFRQSRNRAGNYILENLLDSYLPHKPGGDRVKQASVLKVLSYVGELEYRNTGDRFTQSLARFDGAANPFHHKSLIRARSLMKAGQAQLAKSDFGMALNTYTKVKRIFDEAGGESESRFADYWIYICRLYLPSSSRADHGFSRLASLCEKDEYRWLVVRCLNGLANYSLATNDYSKAIDYANRSKEIAEQIQDPYGLGVALTHLVEGYRAVGNYSHSLACIRDLLSLAAESYVEPTQSCMHYSMMAWALSSRGFHLAALQYQKTALEIAKNLKELTMICPAYVHTGIIYARLKNLEAAHTNLELALEMASNRADEQAGMLMKAYSSLHLGNLYRQSGDIARAIESYEQSVEIYEKLAYSAFVHQAHKGLLLSHIDSGDIAQARAELDKTISYYEAHRSKIVEQSNRNSYFDIEQDVYDLAIDFENSSVGDPRRSFEYSEMSRGRSLLDILNQQAKVEDRGHGPDVTFSASSSPLGLQEIQRRLPERAQVLQYALLEDKLLCWVITRTLFERLESDIRFDDFNDQCNQYASLVSAPGTDRDHLSQKAIDLYKILVAPAEAFLDKQKQLFIIPDKVLNKIPFQTLVSPLTGEYLIREYPVALAPSSSVLVVCSEAASRLRAPDEESVLSVGVTKFSRGEYGRPKDLPSAATEATEVGDCYGQSRLLLEAEARKRDVLRETEKVNVLHFASHFIINESSPMRSRLLLGKQPGADGSPNDFLEASEIHRMKLDGVRLVTLSACQTGAEQYYRGEGAISIGRSFLAAGVPMVVASLWVVDSDSTSEIMIKFHRNRKRLSSLEALRRAQLDLIDNANARYRHPYYWAAFNLIGGQAEY
jgi:CHAT domain-containing protein